MPGLLGCGIGVFSSSLSFGPLHCEQQPTMRDLSSRYSTNLRGPFMARVPSMELVVSKSSLVCSAGFLWLAPANPRTLDNVSLTYPYTDTQEPVPALSGVSFVLPASSITAIVSVPSSTKSSILKALYRLYDVDSGSIYLNGIPIHSLSLASLRSLTAAVPDICSDGRAKALSRALAKDAKVVLLEGPLDRTFIGGRTVVWEVGTSELDGVDSVDQ